MNRSLSVLFCVIAALLASPARLGAAEAHAQEVLADLLATRDAIRAVAGPEARFVTVWDFDGTILDGDCTDDFVVNGEKRYPGLVPVLIDAGLSSVYPPEGGADPFWATYAHLEEEAGPWIAYPMILQIFRGADAGELSRLARDTFERHMAPHYFSSSRFLIDALQASGIEVWVISASPQRFVRAAAGTLGVPEERIHGIRGVESDGRMTDELLYPVTWADGKRDRLQALLAERTAPTWAIGGFGNSYGTDGAFLAWIAQQALPAGKPVTVMINGGEAPDAYRGRFREVGQSEVAGSAWPGERTTAVGGPERPVTALANAEAGEPRRAP